MEKACVACRHDIRTVDKNGHCTCHCEIDGHYIGHVEAFEHRCKHWAKDHTFDEEEIR